MWFQFTNDVDWQKKLYIVLPVYDGIKHIKRRIEASYEVFFSLISFYRCFVCAPSKLQ